MTELMRRRRAMMTQKSEGDILYQFSDYAFDGEYISTGVKPFETAESKSIAVDITLTAQTGSNGNGSGYRLVECNFPSLGLSRYSGSWFLFAYRGSDSTQLIGSPGNARFRFVINMEIGIGATIYFRKNTGEVTEKTIARSSTATNTGTLKLGGISDDQNLPKGTINTALVYNRLLSSAEINNFLGVS